MTAWETVTIGSVCTTYSGGTPSTARPEYYGGDIPWIASADLNRGRISSVSGRITRLGLERSSAKLVKSGTPLIALYGATAGVTAVTYVGGAINQAVLAMIPRGIDAEYLYQWLKANRDQIIDRYTQGGQPNLSGAIVRSIELPLPPAAEQRRVAEALRNADDVIATLERMIAKKQAIKQGMMQQLLTGKTRLPGFTEPWDHSTVGSLARVTGGGTPSTRVSTYWGGGVPWFTPAEIKAEGSGLVARSERTITQEGLASSAANLLPAGSVLVTSRASIGNCAVAAVPVTTNQGFTSMIPKDRRSTWFLYHWVQQNRSVFESRSAGSTFLEISASEAASIPLEQPSLDEQQAIGEALRDTDTELDALKQRLVKAGAVKTGMMQQLLTGRTRLPVKESVA